jgi:hypothetical protein
MAKHYLVSYTSGLADYMAITDKDPVLFLTMDSSLVRVHSVTPIDPDAVDQVLVNTGATVNIRWMTEKKFACLNQFKY